MIIEIIGAGRRAISPEHGLGHVVCVTSDYLIDATCSQFNSQFNRAWCRLPNLVCAPLLDDDPLAPYSNAAVEVFWHRSADESWMAADFAHARRQALDVSMQQWSAA